MFDNTIPLYSFGHMHMVRTNGEAIAPRKPTNFGSWKESSDCQAALITNMCHQAWCGFLFLNTEYGEPIKHMRPFTPHMGNIKNQPLFIFHLLYSLELLRLSYSFFHMKAFNNFLCFLKSNLLFSVSQLI